MIDLLCMIAHDLIKEGHLVELAVEGKNHWKKRWDQRGGGVCGGKSENLEARKK